MSRKVRRLFSAFRPKHYSLFIDPDRDSMTISGTVTIEGTKVGRPAQRLVFHQNGLTVSQAVIIKRDKKGEREIPVKRIVHHESFDEVRLHTGDLLYPGEYTVTMKFAGQITKPMDGVYPCFFKHNGQEKKLIATQFESHFARQAFPCIDEPEAKATFDLSLVSPKNETALGNTPIKSQEKKGNKVISTFETTPKMSTYLLAFIYGELGYKEAKTKNGTIIRTYATPDNVQHTEFALDVAVCCLEFFEDYFAIPFPLPKCDFVALPDFWAGAMENWGLITFREQALFVDPDNTSLSIKQHVAEVVCHELTHQWFGNLVTMRWWTDLWLNEGFANLMAFFAVDKLFPEWKMMTQYIVEEQQLALKLDALENTHPIEVAVNHPDEIRAIFDAISYSKGGSILLMLMKYLGDETFRDGLRHYLKTHAYSNTDTVDLWDSLETASKKSVKDMMTQWTSRPGYPVVHADVKDERVCLMQEPFFTNPAARKKYKNDDRIWPVALCAGNDAPDMMATKTAEFDIKDPKSFKLNHEQVGLYRTIYNPEHVKVLADRVRAGELGPLDRLGILSDAFEAAKAGYSDTVSALELLEAYENEDNCLVWDVIARSLGSIRSLMDDEELRKSMKPYVRKLVAKQLKRLGWEEKKDEPHFDKLLRPTILALAAAANEKNVVDESLKRFREMTRPEDLPPDLRGMIYTTAARHGDAKTFEKLLKLHDETASPEEKLSLAAGLTDFKQPELIKRALEMITSDKVRLQDTPYWIIYNFGNRHARHEAWRWLCEHWPWLKKNTGTDMSFAQLPIYTARVFSDAKFLPEYKKFFESVMEPMLERSFHQGVEMIEWQSAWRSRDLAAIKNFFKHLSN